MELQPHQFVTGVRLGCSPIWPIKPLLSLVAGAAAGGGREGDKVAAIVILSCTHFGAY